MAKVKIFVGKNETVEDVEDSLVKAFNFHASGDVHDADSFEDPAMNDLALKLQNMHQAMYEEAIKEICEVLDQDYSNGN